MANSDEFDYEIWETTLIEQGLWDVVVNGVPPDPSKIPELSAKTIQPEELAEWRDLAAKDTKAIQVLQSSLPDSVSMKTLSASLAKEVWDLLQKGNEEAKILRLEKQFEEISMGENESTDSFSDRVDEIILQLRDLKVEKSGSEFMKKLLDSSRENNGVATLLKELNEVHNMSFEGLVEYLFAIGHGYKPITEEILLGIVKDLRRLKSTYDEDMWMVSSFDAIHMTRYEKYFTTLDRTHKAKVEWVDGTLLMVGGKGDVKILMKDGKKKTISNVLFVPEIDKNVLSLSQLESRGYSISEGERGEHIISDRTGAEFGETMWVGEEWALRLQVIEGNLTS